MPSEALDQLERALANGEAAEELWGDLAAFVAKKLTAAGLRRHSLSGEPGGFGLSLWDDGVIVTWLAAEASDGEPSPFEKVVEHAMYPALEQILRATGFAARVIPEEEDNGGLIRVTGWHGPGSEPLAAEP